MTDEERELCKNLRALSPGYLKMDGSYVEIGLEAAELIERLAAEPKQDVTDKMVDAARRSLFGDLEIGDPDAVRRALEAALAQSDAEDKPLGFRTWDVPNPYAEGPQSDDEPIGEVYDKIKGHAVTQSTPSR